MEPPPDSRVERMRRDLAQARRDHDRPAISALRTVLSAMANAEAPLVVAPVSGQAPRPPRQVEVDRLVLSPSDLEAILEAEIADREDTIAVYLRHGRTGEADELRAQVQVLRGYQP